MLFFQEINTPIGTLLSVFKGEMLCFLNFTDVFSEKEIKKMISFHQSEIIFKDTPAFSLLKEELNAYFEGALTHFSVKTCPFGTEFQLKVWQILQQIPYGETISYQEQALLYGNAQTIRAVASANGKNPIAIVIPCHRVIGKNGHLTGYAGGIDRKRFLLEVVEKNSNFHLSHLPQK